MALINCSECGKKLSDKAASCPNCGNPMNAPKQMDADKEYLGCPKCRSQQLHSEQTGFSGGKALAGAILTGGIGLLAGTIGSKELMITCLKCGNVFKAGEAITILTGRKEEDLENRVAELLIKGDEKAAIELHKNETNSGYAKTMVYLLNTARKRNIEYKHDFSDSQNEIGSFFLDVGWKIVLVIIVVVLLLMLIS